MNGMNDSEIDRCDVCNKAMSESDFAFIADEDFMENRYSEEFLRYLLKNHSKLCLKCLKIVQEKYSEMINGQ